MNKPNQASVPAQGTQHTAGPWTRSADGQRIIGTDGESIIAAIFGAACGDQDGDANARLIAAAPEMLRRLQSINILTLNQSVVSPGALRELLRDIGEMARDAIAVAAQESREVGR